MIFLALVGAGLAAPPLSEAVFSPKAELGGVRWSLAVNLPYRLWTMGAWQLEEGTAAALRLAPESRCHQASDLDRPRSSLPEECGFGLARAYLRQYAPFAPVVWPPAGFEPGEVVLSEIMWAGSLLDEAGKVSNSSDEWVELYNTTNRPINLIGSKLLITTSVNRSVVFSFNIVIQPYDFLIISRQAGTSTMLARSGKQMMSLLLSDDGALVQLINNKQQVVDRTPNHDGGWSFGKHDDVNGQRVSMQRRFPIGPGHDPAHWGDCSFRFTRACEGPEGSWKQSWGRNQGTPWLPSKL